MTKQYISVGFFIVIFFAGFLGGYVVSEQIYSPENMMARDPDTTKRWMKIMLNTMMNDQELHDNMIEDITKHPQMMDSLRQNQEFMNKLSNP